MSDFPGEITKQILSAPPRIRRSRRYSETAQGRSVPSSSRLPTGSNSFEKASGWIRLPRPAAGTMPHMSGLLGLLVVRATPCGSFQQGNEFAGPLVRCVLVHGPLARPLCDASKLGVGHRQGGECVGLVACDQDLGAGSEERLDSWPVVAQERNSASRGFKQSAGRAPTH